jgi:hypothetical protein
MRTLAEAFRLLTLTVTIATPKMVIQMATFRSGLQNWMTSPAAVRFVGVAMMYLKK